MLKKNNNNQKLISAPRSKNNNHTYPLAKLCFSVSPGPCDLSATIQLKTNKKAYLRFWQVKDNLSWSKTPSAKSETTSNLCLEEGL